MNAEEFKQLVDDLKKTVLLKADNQITQPNGIITWDPNEDDDIGGVKTAIQMMPVLAMLRQSMGWRVSSAVSMSFLGGMLWGHSHNGRYTLDERRSLVQLEFATDKDEFLGVSAEDISDASEYIASFMSSSFAAGDQSDNGVDPKLVSMWVYGCHVGRYIRDIEAITDSALEDLK